LFDEPDAGLDIVNLRRLSAVVTKLSTQQNKACITVSHEPFYIAQVANKMYRMQEGKLKLLASIAAYSSGSRRKAASFARRVQHQC